MEPGTSLRAGTISGTLLEIVPTILSEDIGRTIIVAVVGAVVSFLVSLLLKWFTSIKKKNLK